MSQTRGVNSGSYIAQRLKSVFSGSVTGFSVLLVSVLLFASAGAAETFTVDSNGGDSVDYTSIQEALSAAADNSEDDAVIVNSGTYNEQVEITNPGVNLTSAEDSTPTITYQPENPSGAATVDVAATDVEVSGFTIERVAHSDRNKDSGHAQAVRVSASDTLVKNNELAGDLSTVSGELPYHRFDGLMVIDNGEGTVSNVEIEGNEVSGFYTGIMITSAYSGSVSDVSLQDNVVSGNEFGLVAKYHGSEGYDGSQPTDITGSENDFTGNTEKSIHVSDGGNYQGYPLADFDPSEISLEGPVQVEEGDSIQTAVNVAAEGSTVEVEEGEYVSTESSNPAVLVDKEIDLVGIGEPTVSYEPSSSSGDPTIKMTSDGATLEGFDIDRVGSGRSKDTVAPVTQGIRVSGSDIEIRDNNVDGSSLPGLASKGIMVLDDESGGSGEQVESVTVVNNEVSGFYAGLSATNGYGGSISDVTFSSNTVEDNSGHGVNVATFDSTTPGVEIVENTFSDNNGKTLRIYGSDESTGLVDADASSVSFNQNAVPQNSAIDNNGAETLNAEHNFFGSESGPSEGQIQGDVDYRPWRMNPIDEDGFDEVITFDDSESWSAFSVAGEVADAESASEAQLLGYNPSVEDSSDGWTSPGLGDMDSVDAAFVKGTKAVGVNYEEGSDSVSRSLGEGWNFVGAFENGEAQSIYNVFGTVESSMVSFQIPDHNTDKSEEKTTEFGDLTGSILSTANWGSKNHFGVEASVFDGYWVKASEPASFGTNPVPSSEEG